MNPKTSSLLGFAAAITALIGLGAAALYLIDPLAAFERGLRYVFFLIICAAVGIVVSAILGFFWILKSKGKQLAKRYILAIGLIAIICLSGFWVLSQLQHREYQKISFNQTQRQYLITIPTTYSANDPVPLLLALHGGGGNAKQFQEQSGFDEVAQKEGFIVVYPDGVGTFEYSLHVWNSGYLKPASERGTDDVAFLSALIAEINATYAIDSSRVYITGHSNGGMMTDRMAAERSELFAAAAPVSSAVGGKETADSPDYTIPAPKQPVSIVRVHGLLDKSVLYDGGLTESGVDAGRYDYSVNQSMTFWIESNKCQNTPTVASSSNHLITLERYPSGQDGSEVLLVTLNAAGHRWNDMNQNVEAEQFNGNSLPEMIWNLLKDYTKD